MRKLAANLVVLLSIGLFVAAGGASDCVNRTPCDYACEGTDLGCGPVCECSVCDAAPRDCDAYFNCLHTRGHSCPEIAHCDIYSNAACDGFIQANCQ